MGDPTTILELRQLLAEKFPQPEVRPGGVLPTGIPRLDHLLEGGLWKGALTEIASPAGSGGSALCIHTLLESFAARNQWMALIDGSDSFDPQPMPNAVLSHLLWVRCSGTPQTLRAADLLARDGNLPLVILDLRLNPLSELRKLHHSGWYRLQRLVEQNATTLLVVTPQLMIPCAHAKIILENSFTLSALTGEQNDLLEQLRIRLVRRRFLDSQAAAG